MNYWLHPEARQDLREAARYYRKRAGTPLAQQLLAEFERSAGLLLTHPRLGAVWRHGKRRRLVRQFPYAIVYSIADDQIRVLAVAHASRQPDYWQDCE